MLICLSIRSFQISHIIKSRSFNFIQMVSAKSNAEIKWRLFSSMVAIFFCALVFNVQYSYTRTISMKWEQYFSVILFLSSSSFQIFLFCFCLFYNSNQQVPIIPIFVPMPVFILESWIIVFIYTIQSFIFYLSLSVFSCS